MPNTPASCSQVGPNLLTEAEVLPVPPATSSCGYPPECKIRAQKARSSAFQKGSRVASHHEEAVQTRQHATCEHIVMLATHLFHLRSQTPCATHGRMPSAHTKTRHTTPGTALNNLHARCPLAETSREEPPLVDTLEQKLGTESRTPLAPTRECPLAPTGPRSQNGQT